MKNSKIIDAESDTVPALIGDKNEQLEPTPQATDQSEQAVDDLVDLVESLDDEVNGSKSNEDLTLKMIQDMVPATADAQREDGSSLPLVTIGYGSEGLVNSLARDLALNIVPLPVTEVKLLPPSFNNKLPSPEAKPYDGNIHELFLDSREFNVEQALFTIQSNLMSANLPYPDASIEKFASPEGPYESQDPIAIYGNYIEDYTSPGAGATSVHIVSMTYNNQVYNPDANGKIIISTSDGQLVMYTSEAGLNQDFPGEGFKPGFFYYVETGNANHAPGNGENLLDHAMSITIANNFGATATGSFNVHIIDDVPIAHSDTVKVLQDLGLDGGDEFVARDANSGLPVNQVSGNVLANDDFSVDGNLVKQVMYQLDGDTYTAVLVNGTVSFDTDFGHVTMDEQGNYTYTITATLPYDHVTEDTLQYEVDDGDGDKSVADLVIRMAPAPVITLVPNDDELGTGGLTVTEGTDTSVQYKIVVKGVLFEDLSFSVSTQDNTAFASGNVPGRPDYVATNATVITILADENNALHEATLPANAIVNDEVFEQFSETFDTNVVVTQGTVNSNSDLTVVTTILDDDSAPYVQIIGGTISEGGGTINLEVKLFGASSEPISFSYATSNNTAVASGSGPGQPDYTATSGTITFNPMEATGPDGYAQSKFIAIAINNDTTYEVPNLENFSVNLTSLGSSGSVDLGASTLSATVNIQDDDLPPTLSVGNVSVLEDTGGVDVVITRTGGTNQAISFKLSTADISTTAGSDYTSLNPNTIYTIPASNGNNSITVHIPITIDGFVEPNETFAVNITPVSGNLSGFTNGVVTILNDDVAAQAANDNVTIDPAQFASFNITLILDTSTSMGLLVDAINTRLDVLKNALNGAGNLLDTYYNLSNGLHVNIIHFGSNADFVSETQVTDQESLDDVKNDINGLGLNGGTHYDEALVKAENRFVIDAANSSLNGYINRAYFISDGEPTPGNEGDYALWQSYLSLYSVQSFTANISAGTASNTYLDQIATQTNSPLTFVAANDLSNLDEYLLSTVAIKGNVLTNDAAGSSGPGSVISFTYDNGLHAGTLGSTITTSLGGKFVLYSDGSYNYIPAGDNLVPVNDIFHYTIQDPGGNTSSAVLNLNILAYANPVVLDLNNDGDIQLVSAANSGVSFDVNHDGVKEQLGWVSEHDGLLVYDPNNSGQVTDINQIAFTSYVEGAKTDLEGLSFFDTNHDGKLDANDHDYSHFGVWQDANSNGIVDSGEYQLLNQAGIASITLTSDHNRESDSGNMITGYTSYQTVDGQSHLAADVSLSVGSSIQAQATNSVVSGNDVIAASHELDFTSLPDAHNEPVANSQINAPSNVSPIVIDTPTATVQAEASVTAVLQQEHQESVAM